MDDLDNRARQSMENLDRLAPKVDELGEGLSRLESYLSGDLDFAMRKATESMQDSLENAEGLQKLLGLLFANVLDGSSRAAHAHETSLQQTKRVNDGMGALIDIVSTAMASSASLSQQIVRDPPSCYVDWIANFNSNSKINKPLHWPSVRMPLNKELIASLPPPRSCPTRLRTIHPCSSKQKTLRTKSWMPSKKPPLPP